MAISTHPELSSSALKVLEKRYLKKNAEGRVVETPQDLFRRVAREVASMDKQYGKSDSDIDNLENRFYNLITSLKFLPK